MRLQIKGLTGLRERLTHLRIEEVMARALAEQAERVAAAVREGLSGPAGVGGHDRPWLQSGALRNSVGAQSAGLQAVVGSNDPAAAPQEMGTSRIQARPFLAPIASSMGEDVAGAVGAKVAAALRDASNSGSAGDSSNVGVVQASATGTDAGLALFGLGLAALGYLALKERAPDLNRRPSRRAGPLITEHSSSEGKDAEGAPRPPAGSKPINQTPWSGNHQEIKDAIGAGNRDDTRISPQGEVWSQHPDGSWTNYGPARSFTGSGRPAGQRGKNRR